MGCRLAELEWPLAPRAGQALDRHARLSSGPGWWVGSRKVGDFSRRSGGCQGASGESWLCWAAKGGAPRSLLGQVALCLPAAPPVSGDPEPNKTIRLKAGAVWRLRTRKVWLTSRRTGFSGSTGRSNASGAGWDSGMTSGQDRGLFVRTAAQVRAVSHGEPDAFVPARPRSKCQSFQTLFWRARKVLGSSRSMASMQIGPCLCQSPRQLRPRGKAISLGSYKGVASSCSTSRDETETRVSSQWFRRPQCCCVTDGWRQSDG